MNTITLELLRRGPANNQLLSPLTDYLALVGEHPASDVRIQMEHRELLARLRSLRYDGRGTMSAELARSELGRSLGELLASIPALATDLGFQAQEAVNLRLVLSANELAMLPFELAISPRGFPTEGQLLFQQDIRPVFLTREARRGPGPKVSWPRRIKILFGYSSAGGQVPAHDHFLALKAAVAPWIGWRDMDEELPNYLKVLREVTLESLQAECRKGDYTHVHLLAHGSGFEGQETFGIGLSGPGGELDRVDGRRLGAALRNAENGPPSVVTLCSCDSGNVGGVLTGDASVAHALHAEGVALVVASQFPLSVAGSNIFVSHFYERLLAGGDPRRILHEVRRELFTSLPGQHDYASLVTYAQLPENIEKLQLGVQLSRAKMKGDVLLYQTGHDYCRKSLHSLWKSFKEKGEPWLQARRSFKQEVEDTERQLDLLVRYMESFLALKGESPAMYSEVHCWLAAAAMRWALDGPHYRSGGGLENRGVGTGSLPLSRTTTEQALQNAVIHYQNAASFAPERISILVGELYAKEMLNYLRPDSDLQERERQISQPMALVLCERLLRDGASAGTFYGVRGMLRVLGPDPAAEVWEDFKRLLTIRGPQLFELYSHWRTLFRLVQGWLWANPVEVEKPNAWLQSEWAPHPHRPLLPQLQTDPLWLYLRKGGSEPSIPENSARRAGLEHVEKAAAIADWLVEQGVPTVWLEGPGRI